MFLRLLKSKIHRAVITDVQLEYEGSIAVDQDLMDQAGLVPYELVLVANIANGRRFETYVVPAERSSGMIRIMGAAAHWVSTGDEVIIMAFADYPKDRLAAHEPKIVLVDDRNRPKNKPANKDG